MKIAETAGSAKRHPLRFHYWQYVYRTGRQAVVAWATFDKLRRLAIAAWLRQQATLDDQWPETAIDWLKDELDQPGAGEPVGIEPKHLVHTHGKRRRVQTLVLYYGPACRLLGLGPKDGVGRLTIEVTDGELCFAVDMTMDAETKVAAAIQNLIDGISLKRATKVGRAELFAGVLASEKDVALAGLRAAKWRLLPYDWKPRERKGKKKAADGARRQGSQANPPRPKYRQHDVAVFEGHIQMGGESPQPVTLCLYPKDGDPRSSELKLELQWRAKHRARRERQAVVKRAMFNFMVELMRSLGTTPVDVRTWSPDGARMRPAPRAKIAMALVARNGWVTAHELEEEERRLSGGSPGRGDKVLRRLRERGMLEKTTRRLGGRTVYKLGSPLELGGD